jgi:hypothetical protein
VHKTIPWQKRVKLELSEQASPHRIPLAGSVSLVSPGQQFRIFVTAKACACLGLITLNYIALHSMDPKPVKMTIGCRICHTNTKNIFPLSLKPSHKRTQEYTVAI